MAGQHVLDDGQTQTRASCLPRPAAVDAIETFGQPRQMFRGDADAGVAYGEFAGALTDAPGQFDASALGRIAHRVANQVAKSAVQFAGAADQCRWCFDGEHDIVPAVGQGLRLFSQRMQQRFDGDMMQFDLAVASGDGTKFFTESARASVADRTQAEDFARDIANRLKSRVPADIFA